MSTPIPQEIKRKLKKKRLIFTITTGRSGTGYLAKMLGLLGVNIASHHEPEPKFSHVMRFVQTNPKIAYDFWVNKKLPFIAAQEKPVYIETSHLFCKGFVEPLLNLGIIPDIIILSRSCREVAKSLYELNAIPGRTQEGLKFLLSPDDPGVVPLPGWENYTNYQLCYWYCLEIKRRMEIYKKIFLEKGARVVKTTLSEISTPEGMKKLVEHLDLPRPDELGWNLYLKNYSNSINTKKQLKMHSANKIIKEIDLLEQEVLSILGLNPSSTTELNIGEKMLEKKLQPLISTIILNWNRADLLKRTLESYIKTISVPYEIFIIDNASTDNSREIIEDFCSRVPYAKAIFLSENRGGKAINIGLQQSRGKFLHISENDIEYLPGWCEKALDLFQNFPSLGQLSLFGPVPEDEEVWEVKPCILRHSNGRIIYEALGNVGTTSIIRREVWDLGIRIKNIKTTGKFLFPADGQLSQDIKSAGFIVAWADHYMVKNIGHFACEFEKRKEYYRENYRSKFWLKETGWQARINEWIHCPKPIRSSFLFPEEKISGEKSLPNKECPEPFLWSMIDGWTAEVEVLEFLYALVHLIKPYFAVETGTWRGYAAEAIGKALRNNGRGKLITLEIDKDSYQVAKERIIQKKLEKYVKVLNQSSLTYQPPEKIDFLLLDSDLSLRGKEFVHFLPFLKPGSIIVFHDTSLEHEIVRKDAEQLMKNGFLKGFFIPTPRGIAICQYTGKGKIKMNFKKHKTIIVLGMHRSGTSMTAGVLHRLGVNMGKNLMKGNWANPLGYFENWEFVRLNDRILQAAGGSWNDPPEREKILARKEKFSSEIYNLIQKEKSEIWGCKDPRTTLTIELFLPYLENPYFLICYRNPLSVAESLKRRDGTSIEFGLKLTDIYNQRIVDFLEKHPHLKKIYLPYEDIVSYPELWLKKLVNFLGLNPTNEEFQKALEFIKPKYKNTNFTFINTKSPRVSIIIPVFNKLEYTKQCLDALYKVTPNHLFELIIVNNASTDGTKEFLNEFAKTYPNVKVIHNQENLVFAKAYNQGARAAKGKYLVFLNNDTIPLKDWLEEMLKIIETEKNIGIVGSKLLYPNNTIQHAGVAIADFLQSICPYHIHRKSPADAPEVNVVKDYQAVTGACMLIPKELFDRLGGFDEGFLNGYEDVDLCFQVREAGYRVVYTPKSVLYHFESISEGRFKAEKENEKRLQEKWAGKIKPDIEIYLPKVSAIILNYNNSQDTIKCLESIYKNIKYKRIQVIVIDNASKTEDVLILKKWFNSQDVESIFCHKGHYSYNNEPFKRELIFIENQENLGFAGGNNIGIKYALNCGADYVWLLNNDTIIDKDALIELIKLAEIDKKIGMVSSKLYCYHDPKKVQYNGEKVVYEGMEDVKGELPKPTNFATGCSLLMRRKFIENVGLLDEDYFLYFEDNDISTRALKAGWKVYYNPYSKIYHKGGASVGGWLKTPLSVYYATRNLLLYCYKHDGSKISEIFGSIKCQIFPQLNGDRKKIYAFSQGIEDFIFNKKGKTDIDFKNISEVIKKIEREKAEIEESLKNLFEIGTKEKFYLIKNAFILKSDEYLNKFFNLARVLFLKESYKKDKKEVDYYHQAEVLYNNGQDRSNKII